jgi:hypothetical protein
MVLYPQHEQHFPTKLLPHRIEEYVRSDGQFPTPDRRFAQMVTGQQVLEVVVKAQTRINLTNIDARYFVGTCFHEAGCVNEWDTEVATASCPPGFVSVGAYQIGDEEARRYGFRLEDMADLDKSTECMVRLAEDNRRGIRLAAGLAADVPDPDYTDPAGNVWKGGAMRAYLAIAHNHGMGYVKLTISRYKLDWPGFKQRNPTDNIVDHGYGEDCVTGGPQWPGGAMGARLLFLTQPPMNGPDVTALQKALNVHEVKADIDGTFGPDTDAAVRMFQRANGLITDGKVGASTRATLGL